VHLGDYVRGAGDAPLVVIDQLAPIAVELHVPADAIGAIRAGMASGLPVEATPPGAQPEQGTLTFLDNAVDPSTGTVLVKATFPNADQTLWPGAFVATRLTLRTDPRRIVIPSAAVTTGQSGSSVYVVSADGIASPRAVTVAREVDGEAIVSEGLQAGDTVVTDGQLRLSAGATVDIVGDKDASADGGGTR
jgi:multidrug efflux system membrane fusion protein